MRRLAPCDTVRDKVKN